MNIKNNKINILFRKIFVPQNIEKNFFMINCTKIVLCEKYKKALNLLDLSYFFTYNRNDCF